MFASYSMKKENQQFLYANHRRTLKLQRIDDHSNRSAEFLTTGNNIINKQIKVLSTILFLLCIKFRHYRRLFTQIKKLFAD